MAIRLSLLLFVLTLALAVVTTSTSSYTVDTTMGVATHLSRGDGGLSDLRSCNGNIGECVGEDEEMMMDSETNRRTLVGRRRYISYNAMKKNSIPCSRRGRSYYQCSGHQKANPYSRNCARISRCSRNTR